VQQRVLAAARLLEQGLLDAAGERRHRGDHHETGVASPAGQVDDAEDLARHGVADRHARARELLEVLHVVLVAEDLGGSAALERGPDAVGADVALGVAEARGEPHPVQVPLEGGLARVAAQDHPARVAEDQAHRFGPELVGQVAQDGPGRPGEGCLVDVRGVGHVDVVRRHLPEPRARPGGEDRLADDAAGHRFCAVERRPGQREAPVGPRVRTQQVRVVPPALDRLRCLARRHAASWISCGPGRRVGSCTRRGQTWTTGGVAAVSY
jgi:hypothetical protein